MAENNGRALDRAASRAIRLQHEFSVLSSQFSVSPRLGGSRFFVSRSLVLFPVSRLATLSTIRHRLHASHAPATRRPLLASRRIPLSCPLGAPLPPSTPPNLAHRAESRFCFPPEFLPCNVRSRDAVARWWLRVPAFLRRQQSGAGRAGQPAYRRQP